MNAPDKETVPTGQQAIDIEALSYDEVCDALEAEDPRVEAAVTELINRYAELAGEALEKGEDYLPALLAQPMRSALEQVALEILQEAFEEEMED